MFFIYVTWYSYYLLLFYITLVPEDCKEEIFEAATFRDDSAFVDGYFDNLNENARKQMKSVQTGAQGPKWKQYKEKYGMQAAQIIEGFTEYAVAPGIHVPNTVKRTTRTSNPILSDDTPEAPIPTIVRQGSGMFEGKAGNSSNWKLGHTNRMSGTGYQHPHADAGRPESFKGLNVFPFVTLHGFGVDSFSLWLFPEPFRLSPYYLIPIPL
jgi:hypothetical protein